jgi:hypothetical protein
LKPTSPALERFPEVFAFQGWETDDAAGVVRLRYAFDNGLEFRETIGFNAPLPKAVSDNRALFENALDALGLAAGVSYYKAFVPHRLELPEPGLNPAQRAFFQNLYVSGLGEFGYRNGIDIPRHVDFLNARGGDGAPTPAQALVDPSGRRKSAVLLGGGKDSLVSVEALRHGNEPIVLLTVNPKPPMIDCARDSGLQFVAISRQLDPALFKLNDAGALNGHVPITAIVSLIAVAASYVHGFDTIVLSNERSANEGNLVHDGRTINHQFSKTLDFERDLAAYIHDHIDPGLSYFSLLRPLSEFHIARLMARTSRYDAAFTSCNRAFQLRATGPLARWCGECPKCQFTYLILATAMQPDRLRHIFGGDLLANPALLPGYEELTGLAGHKPWECVGEIAESSVALIGLSRRPEWAGHAVVSQLAPRLQSLIPDPAAVEAELMQPSQDHDLPKRFKDMLDDYIAAS